MDFEQDAHNLGWKLAAVIKGVGLKELLQTYTAERRPIVLQNSALSVRNWKKAVAIPAALGLHPVYANTLNNIVSNTFGNVLPSAAAKMVLEAGLGLGKQQAKMRLLNLCIRPAVQWLAWSSQSLEATETR